MIEHNNNDLICLFLLIGTILFLIYISWGQEMSLSGYSILKITRAIR